MLLRNQRGSRMIELNVKAPQITAKNKKIKFSSSLGPFYSPIFKISLKKRDFFKASF
jgi:hypothetical protein